MPDWIYLLSAVVLTIIMLFWRGSRRLQQSTIYKVNNQSLESLASGDFPDNLLEDLKDIRNIEFIEEEFEDRIQAIVFPYDTPNVQSIYRQKIMEQAVKIKLKRGLSKRDQVNIQIAFTILALALLNFIGVAALIQIALAVVVVILLFRKTCTETHIDATDIEQTV